MDKFLNFILPKVALSIEKNMHQYHHRTGKYIITAFASSVCSFGMLSLLGLDEYLFYSILSFFVVPFSIVLFTTTFYYDKAINDGAELVHQFKQLIKDKNNQKQFLGYLEFIKKSPCDHFSSDKIDALIKKTQYFFIEKNHINMEYLQEVKQVIEHFHYETEDNLEFNGEKVNNYFKHIL